MSQNYQLMLSQEETQLGPLFVAALKAQSVIPTAEFSFAMYGLDADTSYVDFGEPKMMKRAPGYEEVVLQFYQDFFWSTVMQAVAMDGIENGFALSSNLYTIFDSGTSQIVLPPVVYDAVMHQILKAAGNPQYQVVAGLTFIECIARDDFKPLNLMIDNYWFTVLPRDYIWDIEGDGRTCVLLIMPNQYDFAILGQPVF